MAQGKKCRLDYFARNDHAFVYSIIRAIIHYKLSAFEGLRPIVCTPDYGAVKVLLKIKEQYETTEFHRGILCVLQRIYLK